MYFLLIIRMEWWLLSSLTCKIRYQRLFHIGYFLHFLFFFKCNFEDTLSVLMLLIGLFYNAYLRSSCFYKKLRWSIVPLSMQRRLLRCRTHLRMTSKGDFSFAYWATSSSVITKQQKITESFTGQFYALYLNFRSLPNVSLPIRDRKQLNSQ